MAIDTILQINNLHIHFSAYTGMVQAVRGITFHVNRGETVAIVGESGSGKSVTAKAIMGILPGNAIIPAGEILYSGIDLTRQTEKQLSAIRGRGIGMIFQDPFSTLNPIMKVGSQIAEAFRLTGKLTKREAQQKALRLMKDVGIPDAESRINQYPFQLSGGMRQRIVIAIALAGEPDILICDEPTTALDVTVQAKILELIRHIQQERNLAVIFITHDFGVVANMADRVNVMYAGKIVETGTAEEIFFAPAHPYTWALLSAMPDLQGDQGLSAIPGAPPNMLVPPKGDAFAWRSPYAMAIDFEEEPPFFALSDTHKAATWLLHPNAPRVDMPPALTRRITEMGGSPTHG